MEAHHLMYLALIFVVPLLLEANIRVCSEIHDQFGRLYSFLVRFDSYVVSHIPGEAQNLII